MTLSSLHWAHRWIAIPTGVFIVAWLVTGVVSMVPLPVPKARRAQTLDLGQTSVSPMEAALALAGPGIPPDVRSIRLVRLGDVLAYEIAAGGRGPRLVDARSGRPFTVDAGLARSIAAVRAPTDARIVHVDILTRRRNDLTYLWGSLPAHRVAFDDPWATVVYVGAEDGSVRSTTRWSRVMDTVWAFHTFGPLEPIVGDSARKAFLVVISLTALLTALTGYAIVAWRQRRA